MSDTNNSPMAVEYQTNRLTTASGVHLAQYIEVETKCHSFYLCLVLFYLPADGWK